MPSQVWKLIDPFTIVVDRYELALAGVARIAGRRNDTFPKPVHRSIEVPYEKVVNVIGPLDIVREAHDSLVTAAAAKHVTTERLERCIGLPIG